MHVFRFDSISLNLFVIISLKLFDTDFFSSDIRILLDAELCSNCDILHWTVHFSTSISLETSSVFLPCQFNSRASYDCLYKIFM